MGSSCGTRPQILDMSNKLRDFKFSQRSLTLYYARNISEIASSSNNDEHGALCHYQEVIRVEE
jgi:hypothetical protein